nr:PREDICTED: coiled-coil domain-containing protein 39 [Megachile rotundata]
MKLKQNLTAKLESTEERIKMMKKRINNLMIEQDMNQNIINTHSAQLESENHYYRLSCSTESNLRQEARDFEKEWKSVNEIVSNIEKELERMTRKIEISKETIKYDEKGLRELEEMLNQNEDNNQLIEQYIKEDLKEYKELELKRQKLSKELQSYHNTIIKITNEAQEMEIILSRTSTLYDQTLVEYQQIFNQWRESVTMLQQRNNDIKNIIQEIETLHEIMQDKKKVLEESERFLKEQNDNNKLVEESINKLEKDLFKMKDEQQKLKETFSTYENQLIVYNNSVKKLAQRMQQMQAGIKHKEVQIQTKHAKLEKLNKQVSDLTTKLHDIDNQKLDIEEKAKEVEDMITEQEKKKSKIIKEINRLQTSSLRVVHQIKDLENEHKLQKMQYQKESKKFEYLGKLHSKDEQVLEEKKEVLYQVEFELQKSEMKLDRLKGLEYDKSEVERKQQKIEELQNTLNEKTKIFKLLQKQIISLEDDMRKISNNMANDNTELESLKNKRQDLILFMNAGEKELKSAQNRYEEKQVEEGMLRLKVSQMEKTICNLGNNVYDLERYQLELEAAIRERKTEIAIQKESLNIQKRVASNECSELKCAIAERKIRIKQLQARYDNSVALLGTNSDGTPVNTIHLKIQNAQEKYLLQEEGDKLDETIRKTEQEIQAMENTLRIINTCNDKYKVTLNADEDNKSELEERNKLHNELQNAEQNLKEKKEELQSLTKDMQKLQEVYAKILKDIDEAQEQKENKNQYLTNLKQQIQEQKEKISRADKNLLNVKKSLQRKCINTGDNTVLIQEKEVQLRELQEQNSIVLQDIAEFTVHHIETEAYIKKLLAVKNIELPSIPIFNQSPLSSQCHSSTNSIDYESKSTNRGSICGSSRESIGNIVNIEPEFETVSATSSSKKCIKHRQQRVKTPLQTQSIKRTF